MPPAFFAPDFPSRPAQQARRVHRLIHPGTPVIPNSQVGQSGKNATSCRGACVKRPAESTGGWDNRLCYGFCQVGSALRSFRRCGGSCKLVCCAAERPAAAIGAGSGGAGPQIDWLGFVFWSVSSSSSGRAFCSPSGNLLSAGAFQKLARIQHCDVFGSGRGTSTLNLQNGLWSPRGGNEGAPFQSRLPPYFRKAFSSRRTEALSPASRR
jgi:hypothetical protein